jgi:hypothetical protein
VEAVGKVEGERYNDGEDEEKRLRIKHS